jgi:GT2 family glycosyltransferase
LYSTASVARDCSVDGSRGLKTHRRESRLVSIIIVTHNRKNDLRDAITSVRAQTYQGIEIIVVDNGSTDGTMDLLRNEFQTITAIALPRNTGPCVARNVGISNAAGEILFFLDDDATLHTDAITRIVRRFSREPELAVIVSQIKGPSYTPAGEPFRAHAAAPVAKESYLPELGSEGATAIRREALRYAGPWSEHLFQCSEGRDLSYRILDGGYRILHFPEAVAYHRRSPLGKESRRRIAQRKAYLTIRNELWIAWTYLPARRAALETAIKLVYYPLASIRQGTLFPCMRGIIAACRGAQPVLIRRRPIRSETLARMDHMLRYRTGADPGHLSRTQSSALSSVMKRKLRYLLSSWASRHPDMS